MCHIRCPRKALDTAEYREAAIRAGLLRKALITTAVGMASIRHALRASSCPQRSLPEETYTPADSCAEMVADQLQEKPISPILLTESEYTAIKPFAEPESLPPEDRT